MVLELEDDKTE